MEHQIMLRPKTFSIIAIIGLAIIFSFLGGFSLGQSYTIEKYQIRQTPMLGAHDYPYPEIRSQRFLFYQ